MALMAPETTRPISSSVKSYMLTLPRINLIRKPTLSRSVAVSICVLFAAHSGCRAVEFEFPKARDGHEVPALPLQGGITVPIDGVVRRLVLPAARPDLLVASIGPWDTLTASSSDGVTVFSISIPARPTPLGHFPGINPHDLAVTNDGRWAFAINLKFDGARSDTKFGLFVLDLGDPTQPKLASFVPGDFMTMHLAPDDHTLYLQERDSHGAGGRGLLVYLAQDGHVGLKCANPFIGHVPDQRIFVYGMASSANEPLLALTDQQREFGVFNVTDPCHPKQILLTDWREEGWGNRMTWYARGRVALADNGVETVKVGKELADGIAWFYSDLSNDIHWNASREQLVATFNHEVGVLSANANGQLAPLLRIPYTDVVYANVLSNAGWLYVGTHGGLTARNIVR